jgi:hypothetical protein
MMGMIRRCGCLMVAVCGVAGPGFAAEYFVAPREAGGNDGNAGTLEKPFESVQRGQKAAQPGGTVFLRGGKYAIREDQIAKKTGIWSYVFDMDKSGEAGKPITYAAYQDERPVLDFSQVKAQGTRIIAFYVAGSWIHFKGFEVVGVQVTILGHTQSECFENQGSNNVYERLSMHDGQAIGYYLLNGSNNLVLNCDAWNNHDFTSEGGRGGNTDGFGCHPRKGAVNNVFRGCRAWFNSDDGYDCINSAEPVVFENCWAMYNGYSTTFQPLGDGNGFKAGGYGATPAARLPNPIPRHVVRFCVAVGNKANGVYSNHHCGGDDFINNTSYKNGSDFNMLERLMDNRTDVPGKGHVLKNNLGYGARGKEITSIAPEGNTVENNSFSSDMKLADGDFESLDEKELVGPRKGDGGLPEVRFMHPKGELAKKGMGAFVK